MPSVDQCADADLLARHGQSLAARRMPAARSEDGGVTEAHWRLSVDEALDRLTGVYDT